MSNISSISAHETTNRTESSDYTENTKGNDKKQDKVLDEKAVTNTFKDADGNEDLYLTTEELYDYYVEQAEATETKVNSERVAKQLELIKKYMGDDDKLNIDEFKSLCQDPEYADLAKYWGNFFYKNA